MKTKDIGILVMIGIFSAVISLVISNAFLVSAKSRKVEVEVVTPFSSSFDRPPAKYFNQDSVNPTKEIEIKQENNTQPFGQQ